MKQFFPRLMCMAAFAGALSGAVITPKPALSIDEPNNQQVPFRVEVVASDLRVPWSMVFAPDGRLFFTERAGRVRVIENGKLRPQPLLALPDVDTTVKLGVMGVALHPKFAQNGWLYLAYSYRENDGPRVRVVRYRVKENPKSEAQTGAELSERTVIIENIPAATNHAGCRIKFGPDDKLYITTGDADKPPLAQDLNSLAGKTLRLNDDGSVPRDNPFVQMPAASVSPIWSYGHRNAQGMDWQPGTGALFQSEHGPNAGDEINIVERGKNYGWPVAHHLETQPRLVSPLLVYPDLPAIAPASGVFYRGSAFPQFQNSFLVGCLRGECILNIQLAGTSVVKQERLLEKQYGRIREVAVAPDGTIYFSTSQHDPPEGRPRPDYDQILRLVTAT